MKEKKKILLAGIGILMLVLVTVGVTYAVFTYTKLGTTENTVTTGTLKFLYTENTGVGAGINIENAFPVSDSVGKSYDTDKYVFDFSVEATNSGNEEIPYEVTLRKKSTSTVAEKNVKVYLTDMTGDADTEILAPTIYSDLIQTTIDVGEEVEKTIYNGTVLGGELTYLKDFRLRMWIDNNSNQDDINGKTFVALVNVYSNVPLVSEEEINLRNSTEINTLSVNGNDAEKVTNEAYNYEVTLPEGTTSITIDLEALNPDANVVSIEKIDSLTYNNSIIKKVSTSKTFDLTEGDNYFKITITSENGINTDEYILKVNTGLSGFAKKILNDNPVITATPNLKTTSEAAGDKSGLYVSTATNSGKPTYYFRGSVNNYVDFAGFTWRIVRINEDGTIRLILSNDLGVYSYNTKVFYDKSYMYYDNSLVKSTTEEWYTKNLLTNDNKIAEQYFCGDLHALDTDTKAVDGKGTLYSQYTATFKCDDTYNYKLKVGHITYDEVVFAGGYGRSSNTQYYLYYGDKYFWTMSPVGMKDSYAAVWYQHSTLTMVGGNVDDGGKRLRPVINLKPNVTVTGTGKSGDHYKVQ